jgi:hypothetical protein
MASRSKPVGVQGDIFDSATSQARKAEELAAHEERQARALKGVRAHLRALFIMREATQGREAFVTADDAAAFIRKNPNFRFTPGPWMGAIFKSKGWTHTGKWVSSVRASNNGRMNRCWRYDA